MIMAGRIGDGLITVGITPGWWIALWPRVAPGNRTTPN